MCGCVSWHGSEAKTLPRAEKARGSQFTYLPWISDVRSFSFATHLYNGRLETQCVYMWKVQQSPTTSFIRELKLNSVLTPDAAVSYRSIQAVWIIHQARLLHWSTGWELKKKKRTHTKGCYSIYSSLLRLVRNRVNIFLQAKETIMFNHFWRFANYLKMLETNFFGRLNLRRHYIHLQYKTPYN